MASLTELRTGITLRQPLTILNNSGQRIKAMDKIVEQGEEKMLGEFDEERLRLSIKDPESDLELCIQDIHMRNKEKHLVALKDAEGKLTIQRTDGGDPAQDETVFSLPDDDRGAFLEHQQGTRTLSSSASLATQAGSTTAESESLASLPERDGQQSESGTESEFTEQPKSAPMGSFSSIVGESSSSQDIVLMNVSSRRILVNGVMVNVGEMKSIGTFAPGRKHTIVIKDELNELELFTQDVFIQTRPKHLAFLDRHGGGFAIRKQNRSGMPYDGDIDQEEEDDFVPEGEGKSSSSSANESSGISGVTGKFQEAQLQKGSSLEGQQEEGLPSKDKSDANLGAWQDPEATTKETASGEQGPSLTQDIQEPSSKSQQEGGESLFKTGDELNTQKQEEEPSSGAGEGQEAETDATTTNVEETLDIPAVPTTVISIPLVAAPATEAEVNEVTSTTGLPSAKDSSSASATAPRTNVVIPLSTSSIITESADQLLGAGQAAKENVQQAVSNTGSAMHQAVDMGKAAASSVTSTVLGVAKSAVTLPLHAAEQLVSTITGASLEQEPSQGTEVTTTTTIEGEEQPSTASAVSDAAGSGLQQAKETAQNVAAKASELGQETAAGLRDAASSGAQVAGSGLEMAKEGAKDAAAKTADVSSQAYQVAKDNVSAGVAAVENTAAAGVDKVGSGLSTAGQVARETAADTANAGVDLTSSAYNAAKHNVTSGVAALESTAQSAASATADATGTAVEKGKEVAGSALHTVGSGAAAAKDMTASGVYAVKDTAASALETAKETAASTAEKTSAALQSAKETAAATADRTAAALESAKATAKDTAAATAEKTAAAYDTTKETVASGVTMAQDAASRALETAKGAAQTSAEMASEAAHKASDVAHRASEAAYSAAETAADAATRTAQAAGSAASTVYVKTADVAGSAATTAADVGSRAANVASSAASKVADVTSSAATSAKDTGAGAAHRAAEGLSSAATTASNVGSNAAHVVSDTASDLATTATEMADRAVHTTSDAAKSAASTASSAASGATESASNVASSAAGTATDAVKSGLTSVQSGVSALQTTTESLADKTSSVASSAAASAANAYESAKSTLQETAASGMQSVKSAADTTATKVTGAYETVKEKAKEAVESSAGVGGVGLPDTPYDIEQPDLGSAQTTSATTTAAPVAVKVEVSTKGPATLKATDADVVDVESKEDPLQT